MRPLAFLFAAGLLAAWQPDAARILAHAIEVHRAGNVPGAIRLYRQYLESGPPSLDAYTNYGAALAQQGQYAEAIETYRQALHLKADHPPALLNLALAYFKTGRSVEARQTFEAVRPLMPNNLQITLLLADCNIRLGDHRRAIELLEPVEAERPNDLAVAYLLGTALIRDRQVERGSRVIDKILSKGDSAEAHLLIGTAKYNANDFAGARDEFRLAQTLNSKLPGVNAYLGLSLINTGEVTGATEAFRQELEINPESFPALLQLGVLAKQGKNYDESRALLERALRVRAGDTAVRYQLATVDLASGETEAAVVSLEAIIAESPKFREAHVSLATAYYKLKRKEDGDRERAVVRQLAEAGVK
jgi:tetratricopeptide (TPR) repeat protein